MVRCARSVGGLLLALLAVSAAPLAAQGMVVGTVRQDSTHRPLQGVEVLIEGGKGAALTEPSGRYILTNVKSGRRVVLFRAIGYQPVREWAQVSANDSVRLDVTLVPVVPVLRPLDVTGEVPGPRGMGREAFEERRKLGFGKFVDSIELRRSEHRAVSDVLRGYGVYLVRFQDCLGQGSSRRACSPPELRAGSRMRANYDGTPCWMQVVVDGQVFYHGTSPTGPGNTGRPPPDFSRDFRVAELESIEIYGSAGQTPIEFGGSGADCGTIVLWTRRH